MTDYSPQILDAIKRELQILFAAHKRVGLEGQMCLYTCADQEIWRTQEENLKFWFGPDEIDAILPKISEHYNEGNLPNTPLLLNPIIHSTDDKHTPLGSGFAWATCMTLGIAEMDHTEDIRIRETGALCSNIHRAENPNAGLKIFCPSDSILKPTEDGAVEGCKELFEVAHIDSQLYYQFYLLSGLDYLSKNGSFGHDDFTEILKSDKRIIPDAVPDEVIKPISVPLKTIKDANTCWHAYDNHHSLWRRFGIDAPNLEMNLKYYNLCGRDFVLLDHSGAQHADADTEVSFDFLVDGWVPKGAVTIIGATGGTGKSSLAHNLAVKAAIDYDDGEERPDWLGSQINYDKAKGMCIYFSGEDGPAIVHSRAKVYDPRGRANRLMFFRTDFGEGVSFDQFMKRLMQLPDVPLVVIDPARKYLSGDEDDAGVVSEFFEAIEEFAIEKNAACVVVHHLVKNAKPKHVLDIYDMLRGSQVFIDRARVVIGMYREGPYTIAGLAKNNIPPQLGMIQGERVYVRDPEHLELRLLPGEEGIRMDDLSQEELDELMEEKGLKEASETHSGKQAESKPQNEPRTAEIRAATPSSTSAKAEGPKPTEAKVETKADTKPAATKPAAAPRPRPAARPAPRPSSAAGRKEPTAASTETPAAPAKRPAQARPRPITAKPAASTGKPTGKPAARPRPKARPVARPRPAAKKTES